MNNGYAVLGNSCQSNMSVLLDNKKFFTLDEPDYNKLYTKMYSYPGATSYFYETVGKVDRPEDIKTKAGKTCCNNS